MKFVLTFTTHDGGSEVERFEAGKRAQALLAKWQPSDAATIAEWLTRCDGNGGFCVLETDNATELLRDLTTWSSFLKFAVYPVVNITDSTAATEAALATRASVS